MADLIIGNDNLTQILRTKYKKMGKGWVSSIIIPQDKHLVVNSESLRILINELGYECVYITLSKSAGELDKIYKGKGVDINKLNYIDAISKIYGDIKKDTKRIVYASGPLDIDSITVAVRSLLAKLTSEKKCVFLDSVTSVLLYNSLSRTVRFSKFLTQNLKQSGVDGIMVSVTKGKETEGLIKELKNLCDEVITLGGG